jgi:hypothetical protein
MIQIRWYADANPARLQYRVCCNPEELGLYAPIYGDWIDVPMVGDGSQASRQNEQNKAV